MLHFLSFILLGAIAGFIADRVMSQKHGLVISVLLGVVGAWIGGFIMGLLKIPALGAGLVHWGFEVLVAAAGAILLLWLLNLFHKPAAA